MAIEQRGITDEQILNDQFVQWAITSPLYNIGEVTSHVSADLRKEHPVIPWSDVAGTRHRLVHDYGNTDWSIILEIIRVSLPDYIRQLRNLISHKVDGDE